MTITYTGSDHEVLDDLRRAAKTAGMTAYTKDRNGGASTEACVKRGPFGGYWARRDALVLIAETDRRYADDEVDGWDEDVQTALLEIFERAYRQYAEDEVRLNADD